MIFWLQNTNLPHWNAAFEKVTNMSYSHQILVKIILLLHATKFSTMKCISNIYITCSTIPPCTFTLLHLYFPAQPYFQTSILLRLCPSAPVRCFTEQKAMNEFIFTPSPSYTFTFLHNHISKPSSFCTFALLDLYAALPSKNPWTSSVSLPHWFHTPQ